jgi:Arc/MetJ-type ribon-helix-helix transcriptional regulator
MDREAEAAAPRVPTATTAVHLNKDQLALLRRVAVERAIRTGKRPSVSDVLRDLIERHRQELEAEIGR